MDKECFLCSDIKPEIEEINVNGTYYLVCNNCQWDATVTLVKIKLTTNRRFTWK